MNDTERYRCRYSGKLTHEEEPRVYVHAHGAWAWCHSACWERAEEPNPGAIRVAGDER